MNNHQERAYKALAALTELGCSYEKIAAEIVGKPYAMGHIDEATIQRIHTRQIPPSEKLADALEAIWDHQKDLSQRAYLAIDALSNKGFSFEEIAKELDRVKSLPRSEIVNEKIIRRIHEKDIYLRKEFVKATETLWAYFNVDVLCKLGYTYKEIGVLVLNEENKPASESQICLIRAKDYHPCSKLLHDLEMAMPTACGSKIKAAITPIHTVIRSIIKEVLRESFTGLAIPSFTVTILETADDEGVQVDEQVLQKISDTVTARLMKDKGNDDDFLGDGVSGALGKIDDDTWVIAKKRGASLNVFVHELQHLMQKLGDQIGSETQKTKRRKAKRLPTAEY